MNLCHSNRVLKIKNTLMREAVALAITRRQIAIHGFLQRNRKGWFALRLDDAGGLEILGIRTEDSDSNEESTVYESAYYPSSDDEKELARLYMTWSAYWDSPGKFLAAFISLLDMVKRGSAGC